MGDRACEHVRVCEPSWCLAESLGVTLHRFVCASSLSRRESGGGLCVECCGMWESGIRADTVRPLLHLCTVIKLHSSTLNLQVSRKDMDSRWEVC